MIYSVLKFLHILGAVVILGTRAGIAFFVVMAHRIGAAVARTAIVAQLFAGR